MSTKLDRLRTMFPMLTMRTLETALSRFRGNLALATQHLLVSLRQSNADYENNIRRSPCRDPNCKECETVYFNRSNKSPKTEDYPAIARSSSPATYMLSSRKRPLDYPPTSRYDDVPAKRTTNSTKAYDYSRKSSVAAEESIRRRSPVEEIIRRRSPVEEVFRRRSPVGELYPSSADESDVTPPKIAKSRIILPPTLLKRCIDCKYSISVDDKFCGQCGYKQTFPQE